MGTEGNSRRLRTTLIAWLMLLGFVVGSCWLASRFLRWLTHATTDLSKAVVAASATVMIAVVTLVIGKAWEQRIQIREELRQRKQSVYEEQMSVLFSAFFSSQDAGANAEQDRKKSFGEVTQKLLIWAGPAVIKAWSSFRLYDWASANKVEGFLRFEAFIKAIRIELGNSNANLEHGDLLKLFINDLDLRGSGTGAGLAAPSAEPGAKS